MEKWLTVSQVAEMLGVSKSFVYHERAAGRMRFLVRWGCSKGYRVALGEVERWRAEEWADAPATGRSA